MMASYILSGLLVEQNELVKIFRGVTTIEVVTAYVEWGAKVELRELNGGIKGMNQMLLRLDRKRFGPPDAASAAQVMAIRDHDRLERLADAILTAGSWQELLATP